jgi:hypothetical protein
MFIYSALLKLFTHKIDYFINYEVWYYLGNLESMKRNLL